MIVHFSPFLALFFCLDYHLLIKGNNRSSMYNLSTLVRAHETDINIKYEPLLFLLSSSTLFSETLKLRKNSLFSERFRLKRTR